MITIRHGKPVCTKRKTKSSADRRYDVNEKAHDMWNIVSSRRDVFFIDVIDVQNAPMKLVFGMQSFSSLAKSF